MSPTSHLVIGAGAIGTAAAYRLAQRGGRVTCIEQFDLVNALGSSGDHSRIYRRSYHRDEYVALTDDMLRSWAEIEARSGLPLLVRTGGLDLAPPDHAPGLAELDVYRQALRRGGHEVDELDTAELRARFPQWRVPDGTTGFLQPDAGLVDIRRSVSAHTALALAAGVEFVPHARAERVEATPEGVRVTTTAGVFEADSLVIAAASWASELYAQLGVRIPLALSQEQVSYVAARDLAAFTPDRFPVWVWHGPEVRYGFPVYGEAGVKLARDMRGAFIEPHERSSVGTEDEAEEARAFLAAHLPDAVGPTLVAKQCVYDMAPDREFILDTLPELPNVAVFNGAGHAGKFAALIGELLAELLVDGRSRHDLSLFRLDRPALTDPDYEPVYRLQG